MTISSGRPRIGLNAQLLSLRENYRSAGVSRYIWALLTYLPQVDQTVDYVGFLGHRSVSFQGWEAHVSPWNTQRPLKRIAWEQLVQPWRLRQERIDLVHAPVYVGPLLNPCPMIVTVHDLSFFRYPELFPASRRFYLQKMTAYTVTHAVKVLVDSRSTKDDLQQLLSVDPRKIEVIYPGVSQEMRPIDDGQKLQALRKHHQLPERFILFLGTLEPRKNIVQLIEAYALLCQDDTFRHQLVIAGGKGWYYDQIYARVQDLSLADRIIFAGYVADQELPLWYNAAELFVYPSLYEGFGLPPLEAMACGTPTIVTDISSLPESVGEAGLLVRPGETEALAEAIRNLLQDEEAYQTLREAGLHRARGFSWRNTARQTACTYHQVLANV